jgi:hypothetical protein
LTDAQKETIQMSMPEQQRQVISQANGNSIFGPYRTKGYWHEKGRYFNEEAPPPECPFHNAIQEESPQMELPLE